MYVTSSMVRSGGHSFFGTSSIDRGVLLDLSLMKA
eukprot:CAMPEP_0184659172 /NCGR_PEP_ID=MMETSP0308-20130426/28566_1 /TAXON_ID=38269 /ORGANISM="Gloeochaete witrockiana, Strain SAG 46.84" /LENGTH=34 /DNA_ID= /DNA_START= /DNA_END= /DNA_ORIENTATION=